MKKFIIIALVVIVVAVIVIVNLSRGERALIVQTEKVFRDDITQIVTGTGKIYPVTEVKISANVSGKIIGLYAEEGDSVKKGQLLVRLEQEKYRAQVERYKSSLKGAQADVKLSKMELQRSKELYEKNLLSRSELEAAEAKYERAISQLEQTQANLAEAEDALSKTVIRSPLNGVVIKKYKEVWAIALGSQFQEDVILLMADLSQMEARVEVNENDIVNVTIGDTAEVEIDAFPDTTFKAVVTDISNLAETRGQGTMEEVTNFLVHLLLLDQLPAFRPGMSATADIATETHKDVLNIPIQALTAREKSMLEPKNKVESTPAEREAEKGMEKKSRKRKAEEEMVEVVFVVENGIAHMRPVKVGLSDENYYEVLEGLHEGEEVVTGPFRILSRKLKDGDKVKVVNRKSKRKTTKEG